MPTAAKLIGGIALGLTALVAAYYYMLSREDYRVGLIFVVWNFPLGFFVGWYSLGRNPGHGNLAAWANGVRTAVLLLIASSFAFSLVFILTNLKYQHLKDPIDLPLLWIEISFKNAASAMTLEVALALLIGSSLSGIAAYQASRRWN